MISLQIGEKEYFGWSELRVTRSMSNLAGAFEITMTDAFREQENPAVTAGTSCKVLKDGVVIKTGYIDRVSPRIDRDSISYSIVGRDKASDLVDCSVNTLTNEWKNLSFNELVDTLIKPFSISATYIVSNTTKFESITWDEGTKVFELIRKYAEKSQLLIYSGFNGEIIVNQASSDRASFSIIEGQNILSAYGASDMTDIFSSYIVIGDSNSTKNTSNEEEIFARRSYKDDTIGRFRPIVIIQEGSVNNDVALKRAKWEATSRLALKEAYIITVNGWHPDINKIVTVNSQTLGISNKDMLIAEIELSISDEGETTIIKVVPPEAFAPIPPELLDDESLKSKYSGKSTDEIFDAIEQEELERVRKDE